MNKILIDTINRFNNDYKKVENILHSWPSLIVSSQSHFDVSNSPITMRRPSFSFDISRSLDINEKVFSFHIGKTSFCIVQ